MKPGDQAFYRRNLPHLQPPNAILFITARLDGSLPKKRIIELREIKQAEVQKLKKRGLTKAEIETKLRENADLYLGKFDDLLDRNKKGPHWLKEESIAKIWIDALNYFDTKRYQVICSTVMSNHVHFIFHQLDRSLANIMHSLKSFSGIEANKILGRTGQKFWQAESFDRLIRDTEELERKINYVLNNPVKAGLVKHWKEWQYNYVHPDFQKHVT